MAKYLSSTPNIMGGAPVIKGTRIPIHHVLLLLKQGYTVETLHELYPHVKTKEFTGAIEEAISFIDTYASQVL